MTDRIGFHLWWKQDMTTTWPIVMVQSTLKMILNFRDQSDQVPTMTKTKQDNYMTNYTNTVYFKNETELPWPIKLNSIYNKSQKTKWHNQSYMSSVHWHWNWTIRTYLTRYFLWWKPDRTMSLLIVCLRQKQNWVFMTDQTRWHQWRKSSKTTMWPIV